MTQTYHSSKFLRDGARCIAEELCSRNKSLKIGTNLFIEAFPNDNIEGVVICENASSKFNINALANRRSFVFQARAVKSTQARTMLWNVFDTLMQKEEDDDSDVYFFREENRVLPYQIMNTPHRIGIDENNKIVFSFAMYIIIYQ